MPRVHVHITPNGERISKVTRPEGSVLTVVVPYGAGDPDAPEHWERPWIYDGDVDLLPVNRCGDLNVPRWSDPVLDAIWDAS